jgi:hypothetical protein
MPHAWSEKGIPPPPSTVQLCIEQGPISPHSASVVQSCGSAMLHAGKHVPPREADDAVTTRQQTPASAHDAADVHEPPPALPESTGEYPSVLPVTSTHPAPSAMVPASATAAARIRTRSGG